MEFHLMQGMNTLPPSVRILEFLFTGFSIDSITRVVDTSFNSVAKRPDDAREILHDRTVLGVRSKWVTRPALENPNSPRRRCAAEFIAAECCPSTKWRRSPFYLASTDSSNR
jgi:hypothetical protein